MKSGFKTPQRSRLGSLDRIILATKTTTLPHALTTTNISEREQRILKSRTRENQLEKETQQQKRNTQILKKNINYMAELAKTERIESSRGKEKLFVLNEMNERYQIQIKRLKEQIKMYEQQYLKEKSEKLHLQQQKNRLENQNQEITRLTTLVHQLYHKISNLQSEKKDGENKLEQIKLLKQRIKILENQIREVRVENDQSKKLLKKLQAQKLQYQDALNKSKPEAERERQRVKYFERVISDMQKKLDRHLLKQYDYLNKIETLKESLEQTMQSNKVTKSNLETALQQLNLKDQEIFDIQTKYDNKSIQCQNLQKIIQEANEKIKLLQHNMLKQQQFYASQNSENKQLKLRNKTLQEHQLHMRRSIEEYKSISKEVNLVLISKDAKINKLKKISEHSTAKLEENLAAFQKFSSIIVDSSDRNKKELKESVQSLVLKISDLQLKVNYLEGQLDQQALLFGEQRDMLKKQLESKLNLLPDDSNLYQAIYAQKNQQMRLLQNSNQMLLKVKNGFEQKVIQLKKIIENLQIQNTNLKIKAVELYKLNKQHEQLKEKEKRGHLMIQQLMQEISCLNQEIEASHERINKLTDDMFKMQYNNKDRGYKIQQLQKILAQLDIKMLEEKKQQNQKKEILLQDAIEKLANALKSINIYFTCCKCDKLLSSPITVFFCGHNYCQNCKKGYDDYCYECNTGLPIQRVFKNKALIQAVTKFKFFALVFQQIQKVIGKRV